MSSGSERVKPRTFFLNERHELSPRQKEGGGRTPQYSGISWAAKSKQIRSSLRAVAHEVQKSHDPLKDERYFIVALPVQEVEKVSKDKRKAPTGTFLEAIEFGDAHGRTFDRLGLDLLRVTDDGKAVVHAKSEVFDQLVQRTGYLENVGPREQSRWAAIEQFDIVPLELRVDADWLDTLHNDRPEKVVIELQPVLTRVEADRVLRQGQRALCVALAV